MAAEPSIDASEVVRSLKRAGSSRIRDELEPRYGIVAPKAFGVPMAKIQALAKRVGRNDLLADPLWETGWYEARLLVSFVAEPERVTLKQMNRWCKDFDNWAVCDTLCFHLLDRTPHALGRVHAWSVRREEFQRRAGFALLACVAAHRKDVTDAELLSCLPLIQRAASDDRKLVKKGVSWALRAIGSRGTALNAAAFTLADNLAGSGDPTERWIGKDAVKALNSPATRKRLARKEA